MERLQNIKVVAFDCDGVMFDTVKANTAFYNRILNHLGLPDMTPQQFDYASMHTADSVLAELFKDPELYEAAQDYRRQIGYQPFIKLMEMDPYLKTLLVKLRSVYKTAIATNRTDSIDWVLQEFDLKNDFDFVVSAMNVKQPKPDPELLLTILKRYQIGPRQAVYVGDSKLDELAARAAGVYLIACRNMNLDADYHIDRLQDLEKILAFR